jgi:flagellar biosynthesis protein FliP
MQNTAPLSLSTENAKDFRILEKKNSTEFFSSKKNSRFFDEKKIAPLVLGIMLSAGSLWAQVLPRISIALTDTKKPADVAVTLQIIFLITILALAPSILIMMTSFIRIIIVMSFLRKAIGTQTMPPDQILVGLSLFLTIFIMMPVFNQINDTAFQPYMAQQIDWKKALTNAEEPVRNFMLRQVKEKDVALFVKMAKIPPPRNVNDLPFHVVLSSFVTSELKTAFIIGFILYIPFLVIDMIVASILMSMGMMMLPPTLISMPFKIILFVLVDGWTLIVKQLVLSFQ